MKNETPICKYYSGRKVKFTLPVSSHATYKQVDYIDLFFSVGTSQAMVHDKINKIVIDNIYVGKNKYSVLLKLKLPKKLQQGHRLPIVSFRFVRKTKKYKSFICQDGRPPIEINNGETLEINK